MAAFDFDLFVLGVGSGGVRAARMSAGYGARVATAEAVHMGGTCVNVGCIPKKLYVYGAHFAADFEDARAYGWDAPIPDIDWATLKRNKDVEIKRLNGIYGGLLDQAGVTHFDGRAVLVDAHTVAIGEKRVTAEKILVATGSKPFVQDIPGKEYLSTSDDAFALETLPRRVLVLGGGYIAVEFAGIFAGLGVETTLAYRGPKLLRGFDEDIRDMMDAAVQHQGIKLALNTTLNSVQRVASGALSAEFADGSKTEFDFILAATGRTPNSADLGLEALGVAMSDNGAIIVDQDYRTSVPHIYALGDVIDRFQLTPVAIKEAMVFAANAFAGGKQSMNYDLIATAVFCQPNVGVVGLTEKEAQDAGHKTQIFRSKFRPLKHTLTGRNEQSLMKLVVDAESDRVLGIHMIGAEAGEIIQGFAAAMTAGVTKAQLDQTVGIHPTAAEEFVTMREPVAQA
ncbi:MAG: glutathione-disulfide reductase [Pseudomonadales bacterium]|jgi:glutathione reductase (NADPH)